MQVNTINNQNFQGFNYSKAGFSFTERLKTPKRYIRFSELEMSQQNNPFNIEVSIGKKKNIIATITDKQGNVVFEKKENALCGILNLNPINFLKDLCKEANNLNSIK